MTAVDAKGALERISREECVALLRSQDVGRLVVVDGSHPLVFPVNYAMDGDAPVFRTASGTKLWAASRSLVAFEADEVDRESKTGWSVVVQGVAQEITAFDAAELRERIYGLPVEPWAKGEKPSFVRVAPRLITGRRIRQHWD